MHIRRFSHVRPIVIIIVLLGWSVGVRGATVRYVVEQEIVASRTSDGRLCIQLGGILEVRAKEEPYLRVSVRGAKGSVWVEPLRVTLISTDGGSFPGGFTTCAVGRQMAEVLVQSSFAFTVDAGDAFVPKAGSYRAKIEALATGADGQCFLLEAESPLLVREPGQAPEPTSRQQDGSS